MPPRDQPPHGGLLRPLRRVCGLATAAALFTGGAANGQVVVFADTSPVPGGPFPYFAHGGREYGNEVVLEVGTPRDFHSLSLGYWYVGDGGATAVIRFYELDGAVLPPPLSVQTPGTELYASVPLSLNVATGVQTLTLTDIGAFELPERVAFTIQFDVPASQQAGLILAGGVASAGVGQEGFWELGPGGWELLEFSLGGQPYSAFNASLIAVPEPAPLAAATALLLAGWTAFRHRRATQL